MNTLICNLKLKVLVNLMVILPTRNYYGYQIYIPLATKTLSSNLGLIGLILSLSFKNIYLESRY